MNPAIHSRFGLLCPSCEKKLINPNQPWPQECATCGQRTHLKCLNKAYLWQVDLDIEDEYLTGQVCAKCLEHAGNNLRLIEQIPHASGDQPISIYRRWKAQQPQAPKRSVINLWGSHRVDPDNFVPAVSKVLDIVHSSGPKVRWAVNLTTWHQVPMTNLASKEITLPNYFDSPHALGRTHQEVLDAMTGAAMHEAGHAAYDSADLILEAQRRIKPTAYGSTWAAATCLNIVCDYNLERRVIERYPAFRHYFTECHRWSVRDTLPTIVDYLKEDGAEDKLNVRLAVLTWEMLGPGDLAAAGAVLSDKLRFITQKCFDILKYAYTRGLLTNDAGKLKTARALYELARTITPVGYAPTLVPVPQPPAGPTPPQQGPQPKIGTRDADDDDDSAPSGYPMPGSGSEGQPSDEPGEPGEGEGESSDVRDAEGRESEDSTGSPGRAGGSSEDEPGDTEGSGELPEDPGEDESEELTGSGSEGPGGEAADDDGTGTDPGSDGQAPGAGGQGDPGDGAEDQGETGSQGSEASDGNDSGTGSASAPGDDGSAGGDPGGSVSAQGSSTGGMSGSETPPASQDAFSGQGDLNDDGRRRNSRRDALDDLIDENKTQAKDDAQQERALGHDAMNDRKHRQDSEGLSSRPDVAHREVSPEAQAVLMPNHLARVRELSPVISRLKKILRFRNADWGGQLTGRRSGTLTRRHVARLSTLHSDKVFHKTQPDATPKVRIALLVDESDSMRDNRGQVDLYIGARNAATALTAALHGIRGVKLWCWGYSMNAGYWSNTRTYIPTLRPYADPYHATHPASMEIDPMFGGTPTGEAMDFAAEVLTKNASPDEKVVVFIITDGEAGGQVSTATAVRKWWGKVTFVHIGLGNTVDKAIPYYVGPVNDVTLLPDLLSESVSEILR